jgi:NAD(P)-dependent dehydrogenase (short-subunit alcohol dehydrogenase family)
VAIGLAGQQRGGAVTDSLRGRVCLVTGATSGIGKATAHALAAMGANVVLVGRDPQKGEATVQEIRQTTANDEVELLLADLSSQASIRQLADQVLAEHARLHVLVNCAGAFFRDRRVTIDGLEMTFALNHLAYFLLTTLLLHLLQESAPARVVNVTSGAHSTGRIDFEDLQGERGYRGQAAYNQSKLANVLFTHELARRLDGTGVTVNCVHPGVVDTNFGRQNQPLLWRLVISIVAPFMRSLEKGAETVVYLSSDPELETVTGKYFHDLKPKRSSKLSCDEAVAGRLWQVSEELTDARRRSG